MTVESDKKQEGRDTGRGVINEAVCDKTNSQPDALAVNEIPGQPEVKRSSPNSLSVIYTIVAVANNQPVIKLDSCYELPHALEAEFLPLADASSAKLFEILVSNPLQTGIRAFLQRRFDEIRAQPN